MNAAKKKRVTRRVTSSIPAPADVFEGLSREQLMQIAAKMRRVANATYVQLATCGVHAFIEFNGLQQKYVDLCERAARAGIDFTMANKHSDVVLQLEDHDIDYLAEKFACIFGPVFKAHPALWTRFVRRVEQDR